MRLLKLLASSLSVLALACVAANAAPSPAGEKSAKDYISRIHIGGWVGDSALLVMPDRMAAAVPTGSSLEGAKLVSIDDTKFVVEYGGVKGNVTLDPWWQLMPHPDLTNWLTSFMKEVGLKIDAQKPDVSHDEVIRFSRNGSASGDSIKVQQARPYPSLPDWMESVDVKVSINPHEATRCGFVSCVVTQDAFNRLGKSMYSKALESSSSTGTSNK